MEDSDEDHRVTPELYFLIAKYLSGGPLKETAQTLLKELETVEVLPRRLDWEGREHTQTYDELERHYRGMSPRRLARVCARALQLAAPAPAPRLSLLGASLLAAPAPRPQDHSLVRRLCGRALGGAGGEALFSPRMLAGLQLQRRTLGHLSAVYCLVFDCTGNYVVTGADDLLVKAWSATEGRLLGTFRGASAEITDVCVSGDNRLLAAGSVDRVVRVWALRSGAPAAVLSAHSGTITSVHWRPASAAGMWLASTATDGSVAFWAGAGAGGGFLPQPVQFVERMRPGACPMICAAWSAGGALLAAGSADQHVRLYSLAGEGGPRRVLEVAAHADAVDSLCWAHRGLRFVSGSKDGTAALWTLHATQWRHTLLHHTSEEGSTGEVRKLKVTMVCWDRSDAFVLTAVSDSSVKVWCSRTCRLVRSLRGHRDEAYVLEAHPFLPAVLLSAGHDGQLFIWDANEDKPIASFENKIEGQGAGAIFDAKWGGGARVAATDSHGHLLLLGLGSGHPRLRELPTELFFHTDYRPVARDALGGAVDEQTEVPPHLMPPPFLVDVEGAPYPPELQRLVPGRETLALSQLIPLTDDQPSQIDLMIQALAGGVAEEVAGGGVWRGGGVRHTAGSWQRGEPLEVAMTRRPTVAALSQSQLARIHACCDELNAWEESWYRREMRRRPVMITSAPRRGARPGRKRREPVAVSRPPQPQPDLNPGEPELSDAAWSTHSSERPRPCTTASSSSSSSSASDGSSSSYSDWVAESNTAALAPPARARRQPRPTNRFSPSTVQSKRAAVERALAGPASPPASPPPPPPLHEAYRPGEWITAVAPRKAPYHPQIGDECIYFRLGHQRYFEAVSEKDVYRVTGRDKPWERTAVQASERVTVLAVKYTIKPPRVVSLRLGVGARVFTVKYHDMPDVIDFLVLAQQYDVAVARGWGPGDRFRCMIDDSWWTGEVVERLTSAGVGEEMGAGEAAHFLSLRVRWDNGELERLSPWDLEPIDVHRMPEEAGGCVPVLAEELDAVLYRPAPHEWPHGDRAQASRAIFEHITQVMSLSVAEPFLAPVDLSQYPSYARVVEYPIDLATIRARFQNQFYRRAAAAQFDVRYLATNAEQFNERHSTIVRQARLVTDLLLYIFSHWWDVDVVSKYHELAHAYRSDDELVAAADRKSVTSGWRGTCARVLREVSDSADAAPFREPVCEEQAPDYRRVVMQPCDLSSVRHRLQGRQYAEPTEFCADMRLIFSNSRLYNTNKRSRIYCMTVRLSALFEALWTSAGLQARRRTRTRTRPTRRSRAVADGGSSSEDETLAATSRRKHDALGKGKGVGKKSKPCLSADPLAYNAMLEASTSSAPAATVGSERRGDSSPDYGIHVLEVAGDPEDIEFPHKHQRRGSRPDSDQSSDLLSYLSSDQSSERFGVPQKRYSGRKHKRKRRSNFRRPVKRSRIRERILLHASTSSSTGSEEAGAVAMDPGARRYESDHSYKPRYSTDDDQPLNTYRQRQEDAEAGPSHRRPRSDRTAERGRYLERSSDSSEELAAISKRLRGAGRQLAVRLQAHAHATAHIRGRPRLPDHAYYNGHAARLNNEPSSSSEMDAPGAVSISSRGRVRRLTAKARGLLRE